MNKPNNHRSKKDLCINPPAIVITNKNKNTTFFNPKTLTPESSITFRAEIAVTIAKTAIGPKGCVNSFCPKDKSSKTKSTANNSENPPDKNNERNVTILKDIGIMFNAKIIVTSNIKPTSIINCKWF